MEDKTGMTEPLVSDEQINAGRAQYKKLRLLSANEAEAEAGAEGHTQGCVAIALIYEAERSKDKARIASLSAEVKAMMEAGQRTRDMLNDLRIKQQQMLDQWAEGSPEKQAELWRMLHSDRVDCVDAVWAWDTATASLDTPTPTPPNK